jgi:hypothetical protein
MGKNENPVAVSPASGAVDDVAGSALKPNYSLASAGNKDPIIGRRFGHWTAVWTDATGKRIHCQCCCGRVRVLGLDQLEAGAISSCGCRPPSLQERVALRAERMRQARRAAAT